MEARHRWRTKTDERSAIIELIEEIDGINVSDTAIILDLVCWLDYDEATAFLDHVRRMREIEEICPGPNPNEEIWAETEDTESYDEDYFFNEGVKAAEELKKERVERYLQLMQCSEV